MRNLVDRYPASSTPLTFRAAAAEDSEFILAQVPRLADFDLPLWRERAVCVHGMRADLDAQLANASTRADIFIAEDGAAGRVGFVHLQLAIDYFSGRQTAHIANLVVAIGAQGRGIGGQLIAFAETWARERGCALLTLAVFPGNQRARHLYERAGFDTDVLRMAKPL